MRSACPDASAPAVSFEKGRRMGANVHLPRLPTFPLRIAGRADAEFALQEMEAQMRADRQAECDRPESEEHDDGGRRWVHEPVRCVAVTDSRSSSRPPPYCNQRRIRNKRPLPELLLLRREGRIANPSLKVAKEPARHLGLAPCTSSTGRNLSRSRSIGQRSATRTQSRARTTRTEVSGSSCTAFLRHPLPVPS